MHDLVIRGGTVVEGTGAPARTADVAIDDGIPRKRADVNRIDFDHLALRYPERVTDLPARSRGAGAALWPCV